MQLLMLMQAKKLKPDEYMDVYLVDGHIKETQVEKRWISSWTLKISNYFTQPWVNVHGLNNCLNQVTYEKLKEECIHDCINCLGYKFDFSSQYT